MGIPSGSTRARSDRESGSQAAPAEQAHKPAHDWTRIRAENWPWIIAVSTVAVQILSIVQAAPIIRAPLVLWFSLFCTGMAWTRLLRIGEPLAEIVTAIALSVALSGLAGAAFLYAGRWSPTATMAVLEAITLAAVLLDLRLNRIDDPLP